MGKGPTPRMIIVTYKKPDGRRDRREFKRLANAQNFAHRCLGDYVNVSSKYATSSLHPGRVSVRGAHLLDLFPRAQVEPSNQNRVVSPPR